MTFEDIVDAELIPNAPRRVYYYNGVLDRCVDLYTDDEGQSIEDIAGEAWYSSAPIFEIFPEKYSLDWRGDDLRIAIELDSYWLDQDN